MAINASGNTASFMDAISSLSSKVPHRDYGSMLLQAMMMRLPEVIHQVGKKKSALYEDIGQGLFPPPVSIGVRAVAWPDYEIQAINAARISGMLDDDIRKLVIKLVEARTSLQLGGLS